MKLQPDGYDIISPQVEIMKILLALRISSCMVMREWVFHPLLTMTPS